MLLTGDRKQLKDFVDLVNILPSREDAAPGNDFGKFWLGNLLAAWGLSWEDYGCRGCIASGGGFFGPSELENGRLDYDGGDTLPMKIVSAWGPAYDIYRLIEERYPDVEISYTATDEFGNFHVCHDPGRKLINGKYCIYSEDADLETDDYQAFLTATEDILGMKIDDGLTEEEQIDLIAEKICDFMDETDKYIEIIFWEER